MPRKIKNVTRDYIVNVPLPNHADTYTVISHQSIIDYAFQELTNQGFGVVEEEYRCTHDGQIAQGIYKLEYANDPELSLMFAWANSYNKQMRFKCAVGTYINNNGAVMIAGEMGTYNRKHTGSADIDTVVSMRSQITNAMMYYDQLVDAKNEMKVINLTDRRQAELLGILFAEYEVLTTEQASFVRNQLTKPDFFYNGGKNTLWAFYNHVTLALQQSHPRTWMEDQRVLHFVLTEELDFTASVSEPVEDLTQPMDPLYAYPGQTNILDQIAEAEENVLTEDELAHELYGVDNDIEVSLPVLEEVIDLDAEEDDDWNRLEEAGIVTPIVQYTDSAGNTFEAPIVTESFTDQLEEAMVEKQEEENEFIETQLYTAEVQEPFAWEGNSITPTPEDHVALEKETAVEKELVFEEETDDDAFFNFDLDFKDDDDSNGSNLFL